MSLHSAAGFIIRVMNIRYCGGVQESATPPDSRNKPFGYWIQLSEFEFSVGNRQQIGIAFGNSHIVAGQIARQEQLVASPHNPPVRIDFPHLGVVRIDQCWKSGGVRARRTRVQMSGRSVVWQTRVRTLGVVLGSELIEAMLLSGKRS